MPAPDAKDYALSRATLLTEGFKGLLVVNGGGAAALLAFISQVLRQVAQAGAAILHRRCVHGSRSCTCFPRSILSVPPFAPGGKTRGGKEDREPQDTLSGICIRHVSTSPWSHS